MKIQQWSSTPENLGSQVTNGCDADAVFVFGGNDALLCKSVWPTLRQAFPKAYILGCSTAGEILDTQIQDDSLAITSVDFSNSWAKGFSIRLEKNETSYAAGRRLAAKLPQEDLQHAFVLSDGLLVNGSKLVRGLTEVLPDHVTLTGGLSANGSRFEQTLVLCDGPPESGQLAILGLYGADLHISMGSFGGWDTFGPLRLVTRSNENKLYELDGKPALELYKTYLGEQAEHLPASALLYPLAVRETPETTPLVRTILGVQENPSHMTFAGDIPEGWYAQLMKANFDRLIDGASCAAERCLFDEHCPRAELALLISCVGRRLVLKQRAEEEIEAVRERLGPGIALTGFYSYGEISPFSPSVKCELHNQTMTITTFSERSD